jgi:hypothetical protein
VAAAAAELAGQLHRGLVGLGAAVAEEHLAGVAGGLGGAAVDTSTRGGAAAVVGEEVADVQQRARLPADAPR